MVDLMSIFTPNFAVKKYSIFTIKNGLKRLLPLNFYELFYI